MATALFIRHTRIIEMAGYGAGTATFDANGVISSVSDERLKTHIRSLPYGLKEILAISPIAHHWGKESGLDMVHEYGGFSANKVRDIMPLAVGVAPNGYLTFNDRPVLGGVVNSIHELHARIVELETQVAALRG